MTVPADIDTRLEFLAAEITALETEGDEAGQAQILKAWEIGKRLKAARHLLPGDREFGRWAKERLGYGKQYRWQLMQLASLQSSALDGISIRQAVKLATEKTEKPEKLSELRPIPTGAFRTIEADPPWGMDAKEGKSAHRQYPTMTTDEIADLGVPVLEHAAPDCHLYLWAINPMLPDAFRVMEAWGFEYKTVITWVKPQIGTGHYYRGATEQCLFGLRGNLKCLRADQPNWFQADRGRHSAKPAAFYDIVESMSPTPRLRMFARSERDGWESWIND